MGKEKKPTSEFRRKLNDWIVDHIIRVKTVQKILFISHLKTMTKAGLSLIESLRILSEEIGNRKLKKVIGQIKAGVEKGKQLSEMLELYPKIFPNIYVSMIAAGEMAGKMEESLTQVSSQMKKNHELTSKIRGALIYPAVIIVAMIGISVEIVFFVLPKLMVMFKEFSAELPLPTRILIAVVDFAQHYGPWLLAGLITLTITFYFLLKKPTAKRTIHKINLKLPIFGEVIKKINLARFTMTLSSLLASTIPIIEAVKICSQVLSNMVYKQHLTEVAEALKKGETLSAILARHPDTFPPMVTEMIMVGETAGKTEQMLGELSEYYTNEVDNTMKNFTTIIEPVIILMLGLAVAGIAVAVIMPMYSLAQTI